MRVFSCAKPGNVCAHYYTHKHKTRKNKYIEAGNKIKRIITKRRRRLRFQKLNAPVTGDTFQNVRFKESDFNVAPTGAAAVLAPATRLRRRKGRRNKLRG